MGLPWRRIIKVQVWVALWFRQRSIGLRAVRLARCRCGSSRQTSAPEACGFVVEGVLRGEFLLQGQSVDDVFMAHHLEK